MSTSSGADTAAAAAESIVSMPQTPLMGGPGGGGGGGGETQQESDFNYGSGRRSRWLTKGKVVFLVSVAVVLLLVIGIVLIAVNSKEEESGELQEGTAEGEGRVGDNEGRDDQFAVPGSRL